MPRRPPRADLAGASSRALATPRKEVARSLAASHLDGSNLKRAAEPQRTHFCVGDLEPWPSGRPVAPASLSPSHPRHCLRKESPAGVEPPTWGHVTAGRGALVTSHRPAHGHAAEAEMLGDGLHAVGAAGERLDHRAIAVGEARPGQLACGGNSSCTRVPAPGRLLIRSSPPTRPSLSLIICRPWVSGPGDQPGT